MIGIQLLMFAYALSRLHSLDVDYIKFSWKMSPRFDACRLMYNTATHEYPGSIMDFSAGWIVEFKSSGKLDKIPDPEYVWEIQGTGDLVKYKRTYISEKPDLISSLPISNDQVTVVGERKSERGAFQLATNKRPKQKDPPGTVSPPDDQPTPPTVLAIERLPGLGSYRVKLTVRSKSIGKAQTDPFYVQNITLRNIVIACVGDSYASGEGNPDREGLADNTAIATCGAITAVQVASIPIELYPAAAWFDISAHRSMKSGYALAARAIEDMDDHSVVTFINLAISGAQIEKGLLQQQDDQPWMRKGQLGYLSLLMGNHPIDVLLLSIGGNDVGFADILTEATTGSIDLEDLDGYLRRIESLKGSYEALNLVLKNTLNIKRVLIAEYPTHLFSNDITHPLFNTNHFSCELFHETTGFLSINQHEVQNLNVIGEALQRTRIDVAKKHKWLYAGGIAEKFKNHGYCSSEQNTLWITATYSCTHQADTRGTMHPNHKGHEIVKNSVLQTLKPILFPDIERTGTEVSN